MLDLCVLILAGFATIRFGSVILDFSNRNYFGNLALACVEYALLIGVFQYV